MEQFGDHEVLETQEVDGVGSMQSSERPSDGDYLGLGDLELVVTQRKAQCILEGPLRIRLQNVVTWPLHHWNVTRGAAAILQRVRVLSRAEGLPQQRCLFASQQQESWKETGYGSPTAELVLTLLLLAHEVDSFRSNCSG